jgi:hypothetical protein
MAMTANAEPIQTTTQADVEQLAVEHANQFGLQFERLREQGMIVINNP